MIPPAQQLHSLAELAKEAGFTKEFLRTLVESGKLRGIPFGDGPRKRWRVRRDWWEAYLEGLERRAAKKRPGRRRARPPPLVNVPNLLGV